MGSTSVEGLIIEYLQVELIVENLHYEGYHSNISVSFIKRA